MKHPKGAKRNGECRNLVVISDTHCGCKLGLCPPSGTPLDDGGIYQPSRAQSKVFAMWESFWNEFVPAATRGEPYSVVHNGDVIDGVHHNSVTQISHNIEDQVDLAHRILEPVVEKCGGRYYHIRGTEAHVGKSGQHEEALAKRLGAIPDKDGKHARFELWKRIGKHLVHFLHHIGTTASSAHESSAVNAELAAEFVEAARWGDEPPSLVVRSHRHTCIQVSIPWDRGFASAVVTPAWQLRTPFSWKIAGARLKPPQIGGLVIRIGDDGAIYTVPKVWRIMRSETV